MADAEESLVTQAIKGIKNVKGHEIVLLDLREIEQSVCDYFIICTGDSPIQVNAISDSVRKQVGEKTNETPVNVEGLQNKQWVILDYSNVVVHIFLKDWRSFYKLEDLWGDAQIKHYQDKE